MDLTLHQLRLLLAVTEHGTISAAADRLGYTSSAISQQLSGLERACGAPILERVGRNVRLTDAGRVLVDHARPLLARAEATLVAVSQVESVVSGPITIAAYESVASTLLVDLLPRLRQRHPLLDVRSRQLEPDDSVSALGAGDVDLAFTLNYPMAPLPTRDDITYWTVIRDRYQLVVATDDPIRGEPVALGSLADRAFISSPPELSCGHCVVTACRRAGFEPNIVHALDDYPTALRLVAAGEGIALLPDLGLIDPPTGVRSIPLTDPFERHIQLAVRTASAARPNNQAVRMALLEVADNMQLTLAAA